jgi:hypothetical protein
MVQLNPAPGNYIAGKSSYASKYKVEVATYCI